MIFANSALDNEDSEQKRDETIASVMEPTEALSSNCSLSSAVISHLTNFRNVFINTLL